MNMDKEERDNLIENEMRGFLLEMHKGDKTLAETLTSIMDLLNGLRYSQERYFLYLLEGLMLEVIPVIPTLAEEKAFVNGHNEAASENNFGIRLAIDVISGRKSQ